APFQTRSNNTFQSADRCIRRRPPRQQCIHRLSAQAPRKRFSQPSRATPTEPPTRVPAAMRPVTQSARPHGKPRSRRIPPSQTSNKSLISVTQSGTVITEDEKTTTRVYAYRTDRG